MKKQANAYLALVCLTFFLMGGVLTGCSSRGGSAGLGALGGAAAGVGGYEYKMHREKQRLEEDLRSGKIDQREYEIRRDQLEKSSIFR